MPIFDYKCNTCGNVIEIITTIEKVPEICPKCSKGKMERQFSVKRQSFDVINGYEYLYGRKSYRKTMSAQDQASVILGEKDPY